MHAKWLWLMLVLSCVSQAAAPREDEILLQGNVQGKQTVTTLDGGATKAEYSYNDRGRGDNITATWKLDAAGVLTEYSGSGNDYMKAAITETFSIANGKASWSNRTEHGEQAVSGAAFYVPLNSPPELFGVLARALLKAPQHKLALLPAGEARIEAAGDVEVSTAAGKQTLTQYRVIGLSFSPIPVWLDKDGNTAAQVSGWFTVIPAGYHDSIAQLQAAQDATDSAWSARIARELTHDPGKALAIRNARLFDPRNLSVTPGMSVLIEGERIARVVADADLKLPAGAEVIDAHGRFLMPGLWDNHQHFDGADGMLDIANGVTSARDLANDTDQFLRRVARFDAGTEIGPRVIKAGIIDGPGPYAVATRMLADTAQLALADVDWYADHGYAQIKIYMSLKPELVPLVADRAHARGLRVSGHVPAFMSARQFIEAGADEIQHFNYVELEFLFPQVQETMRVSERHIKVAEHAREFTPDKPEVQAFIAFLKQHHTVLDPTLVILDMWLAGGPGRIAPGLEPVADRLPVQVRRAQTGQAYEAPAGYEAAYHEAIPAMLKLLKAMDDAGVTIVPGTDALAGYELPHELELYVRAGIAPARVLRMATLGSAEVMGVEGTRGVVAPGKLADLILIDGDPTRNMVDVRNVSMTIKDGKVFDTAAIERALGMKARQR